MRVGTSARGKSEDDANWKTAERKVENEKKKNKSVHLLFLKGKHEKKDVLNGRSE